MIIVENCKKWLTDIRSESNQDSKKWLTDIRNESNQDSSHLSNWRSNFLFATFESDCQYYSHNLSKNI